MFAAFRGSYILPKAQEPAIPENKNIPREAPNPAAAEKKQTKVEKKRREDDFALPLTAWLAYPKWPRVVLDPEIDFVLRG